MGPISCAAVKERWPLVAPFRITGRTRDVIDVVVVTLAKDGHAGRGEAIGVHYRGDTADVILREINELRPRIEAGISRASLQRLLPRGGARNALDCALWDLEAKVTGRCAWRLAELNEPRPLITAMTCGADEPDKMAAAASQYVNAKVIKVKLTGEPADSERVRAVRDARPDVWLSVDANQGFSRPMLEQLLPVLIECRVELVEQPFPVGQEALLDDLDCPIPIAADESVQGLDDLPSLVGRFDVVNIKLDKCGGLSEAIAMARAAQKIGLQTWVGNMIGTSLAMAPAFLLGQITDHVELDGPLFLKSDRYPSVRYMNGSIICHEAIWGTPT